MSKRYNTPHRRHVIKTRMTEEEYADFTERLSASGINQSELPDAASQLRRAEGVCPI